VAWMNTFKIIMINIAVFLGLWCVAEIIHYVTNADTYKSKRIVCHYDWVLYGYCPNIIDVNRTSEADGAETVYAYTNAIGQRISLWDYYISGSELSNKTPDHVFIGDSFIQADEMPFSDTFYGQLKDNYDVEAFGFSSWNIIQYTDIIEKIRFKDTHYHIFVMMNDITPDYDRSVYRQAQENPEKKLDVAMPERSIGDIWADAFQASLFVKTRKMVAGLIGQEKISEDPTATKPEGSWPIMRQDVLNRDTINNCTDLQAIADIWGDYPGYDYAVYAKHHSCWSQTHKDAADAAISALQTLNVLVQSLNSKMTVYLVPAGWSFKNQNTNGRIYADNYFFSADTEVTIEPLFNYLADKMPDIELETMETVLLPMLQECTHCQNIMYLADDGHWTPETHAFLADYFHKKFQHPQGGKKP
jgi:hypothetical protein